eukprot:g16017.t1
MATGYDSVPVARSQQSEQVADKHQSQEEQPRDAEESRQTRFPYWAIALIIVGSVLFVGLIIGVLVYAMQKSSACDFGDAFWKRIDADFWKRIDADEDKFAADVPGAGFLDPPDSARRAQQVFLRQDGSRDYRGGDYNLVWAIEPETRCGNEEINLERDYRCAFQIRLNIGSGDRSARDLPLLLDTGGGSAVWYRDEVFARGLFSKTKRHASTTESPLAVAAAHKVAGKESENVVQVHYPAHGTVEGRLVRDVVAVAATESAQNGRWAGEPLDVGGHARDSSLALIRVTTEPTPAASQQANVGGLTDRGILGLGPRIQRAGAAQFAETRENAMGLSPSVPASTFLEMLSVHLDRAAKIKGTAATAPVFSFDVTARDGSWLDRPHFVVGGTPPGLSLRKFPIAKELQYSGHDLIGPRGLLTFLCDLILETHKEPLTDNALKLSALKIFNKPHRFMPELLQRLGSLQAAEKDKPLAQQKFSYARLREVLDFRSDQWVLHAKRIRIGKTIVDASENWFTAVNQEDAPADEKSFYMETAVKGVHDWSFAYPEDMTEEEAAFGGDIARYSLSNGSSWKRPQKNKLITVGKQSEERSEDRRWRIVLDSGASILDLSPPLWKIFERKRAKKSCLDGPEIGVELAIESGGSESEFWYFVTPKDYCYCGKDVANEGACVSESAHAAERAIHILLGLPFHRAFYVGYDWQSQAVLLPELRSM